MDINATLIGQLVTFLLLVGFTMKWVWPPITKAMREREKRIAGGLEAAERSQRELEMAEHKVMTLINKAKSDAAQIVEQAHKRSAQLIEEAKADARVEGSRIIEQSRNAFALEVSQTKEALRVQLAALAVAGAEKIIQRNLDVTTQTALLDEFVAEI